MPGLEPLDPKTLGQRLLNARKARGLTQEDAARHLGCSRPTFIAIEKGTRVARSEQIVKLCGLYGRNVNEMVRPGAPPGDIQPHLMAIARRMHADDAGLTDAIRSLQRFAEDYRRLEETLKAPLRLNYPPEVQIGRHVGAVRMAEGEAYKQRLRLGLGDQPVFHLRRLLEAEVGLRIIYEDLPSPVAGMFASSSEFGGVIAINRQHPAERRRASLMHAYGHLIADRYKPGISFLSYPGQKPANERFAEAFSMAFLMPSASIERWFNQIANDRDDFQVADLCRLSRFYGASLEATASRLDGLRLIPKGAWDRLKASQSEVSQASEALEPPRHSVASGRFPDRFVSLAAQAFDGGELSEGELVSMLRCDRVTAREIVDRFLTTTDLSAEGQIRQMRIESDRSLLQVAAEPDGKQPRAITLVD